MLIDFRQLFPRWNIKPTGVLHVGANLGEEAPVYHELGIKKVIWIEANPHLMPRLTENIRKYTGQHAFNFAAGEEDFVDVTLHISNNAGQSSSLLELGTHKVAHPEVHYIEDVTVKMHRIDRFFGTRSADLGIHDCDFLSMDIQGFELPALRGMGESLKHFTSVYLEVNKAELYKGCALVEDIDLYLLGYGFKRVETIWAGNTNWGDALYIKDK